MHTYNIFFSVFLWASSRFFLPYPKCSNIPKLYKIFNNFEKQYDSDLKKHFLYWMTAAIVMVMLRKIIVVVLSSPHEFIQARRNCFLMSHITFPNCFLLISWFYIFDCKLSHHGHQSILNLRNNFMRIHSNFYFFDIHMQPTLTYYI